MQFYKLRNSLIAMSLLTSPMVFAEGDPLVFMDVFGGYSWGEEQTAEIDTMIFGAPGSFELEDLDVHNGPAFGGRVGMWMKTHPSIGIAVDVTRFDTDMDNQVTTPTNIVSTPVAVGITGGLTDMRVTNVLVSFDLILRHRGERWTPYIMAGPGIMITNLDAGRYLSAAVQDHDDSGFAYKAGGGISYKISDAMHIFTEYRYIHSSNEYELINSVDQGLLPTVVRANANFDIDVDAHILVGGLSIRF